MVRHNRARAVQLGDSHIANLLIDDSLDYHDAVRFAVFSEKNVFRYEMLYSFFDGYPIGNPIDKAQIGSEHNGAFKMLMAHKIDFRPLSWLSIALSENTMYHSRAIGDSHLNYFNPFYLFHNINTRTLFNSIAWVEVSAAPVKGLNIYGQFALDQFALPGETQKNEQGEDISNNEQNAWGAILGAEYTHTLGRGYFTASLEGAYTTPWFYRRDWDDFIVWTPSEYGVKVYYIGFPYGGDAVVANADFWYTMPGVFKAGFVWQGLIHGETDMTTPISIKDDGTYTNDGRTNRPRTAPYGKKLYQMMFTLAGEYQVPRFVKWMDITARAGATLVLKNDTRDGGGKGCDFQFTAGATFKF